MIVSHHVVVALDESPQSAAALAWATSWARAMQVRLTALHVVTTRIDPGLAAASGGAAWMGWPDWEERERERAAVESMFMAVHPDPAWTLEHVHGVAGPEIVEAAKDADLLVVGTHRRAGLTRLVEGSVSHYCLTHAPCAIVAVPVGAPTREAPREHHASGSKLLPD